MKVRRSILAAVSFAVALSACGASSPPARELAREMVDTLDVEASVKSCMLEAIDDFSLSETDAQGFTDLDDVAAKAADGQERARQIMADFEAALAACT